MDKETTIKLMYMEQVNELAKEYMSKNKSVGAYSKAARKLALQYMHKEHLPVSTVFNLGLPRWTRMVYSPNSTV